MVEEKGEVLLSRREAQLSGQKSYYTGEPCKHGHLSRKQTSSGACLECRMLNTREWRKGDRVVIPFKTKITPSKEYLHSRFSYDKDTGALYWKRRPVSDFKRERDWKAWHKRYENVRAGSYDFANHYIYIRLDGKLYRGHRLVWKMHYGEDSPNMLDHVNGLRFDNRVVNLREATAQENARNAKGRGKYKGVTESNGGFVASYCIDDVSVTSERYSTAKEAAIWYDQQVTQLYKGFAYLNFREEKIND